MMRLDDPHERRARVFVWRLLGVIVGVFILAGLLVVITGWLWPG